MWHVAKNNRDKTRITRRSWTCLAGLRAMVLPQLTTTDVGSCGRRARIQCICLVIYTRRVCNTFLIHAQSRVYSVPYSSTSNLFYMYDSFVWYQKFRYKCFSFSHRAIFSMFGNFEKRQQQTKQFSQKQLYDKTTKPLFLIPSFPPSKAAFTPNDFFLYRVTSDVVVALSLKFGRWVFSTSHTIGFCCPWWYLTCQRLASFFSTHQPFICLPIVKSGQ